MIRWLKIVGAKKRATKKTSVRRIIAHLKIVLRTGAFAAKLKNRLVKTNDQKITKYREIPVAYTFIFGKSGHKY